MTLYPVSEVKAEIAALEDDLKLPVYAPIEDEWQKVKRTIKRKPAWHQLFGGPQDVSKLAGHLGGSFRYDFLYGPWSDYLHAGAVMMNIFKSRTVEGKNAIKPLRHPDGLLQWRSVGPFLAMEAANQVKDKYLGEPTKVVFEREYVKTVKPALDDMAVSGLNASWK